MKISATNAARQSLTVLSVSLLLSLLSVSDAFVVIQPQRSFAVTTNKHGYNSKAANVFPLSMADNDDASTTTTASSSSSSDNVSSSVEIKRLPNSAVRVSLSVPGTATQAAYDKVCREISKGISLPGFRKGAKIPAKVLEQAMPNRNTIRVQAINELVSTLVEPTLKQNQIDAIGQPTLVVSADEMVNSNAFVPGEEVTLEVQCDVWPDIEWKSSGDSDSKPYVGLTGSYQRKPFNQEKMDMALRDLKERYATLEPIDVVANSDYQLQMGDACTVNMNGYMATPSGDKGEPLPNAASGDAVEIILGPGRYMEGLVEGLVGAKVGETKTVSVAFPEKLRDKTLAGKQAIFDVEVLQASNRAIPEITDDFANKVRAGLTAESLMNELKKAIDEEDKKEFTPARNKALGLALAQVMDVDVPDTLVTNQAREKFAVMMAEMRDNGVADEEIKRQINPDNFQKYKDIVKDDIIRDFKVSIATDEIARLENIQVPDFQVEEQMEAIRKDAAQSSEEFDEKLIRAKVETTMQRQAVMDWLADQSNLQVSYGEEGFDESLMQKLAEESLERERKLVDTPQSSSSPVVDAAIVPEPEATESNAPVTGESSSEPATHAAEPVVPESSDSNVESEEEKQKRYAGMSLQERAFQILKETGALNQKD